MVNPDDRVILYIDKGGRSRLSFFNWWVCLIMLLCVSGVFAGGVLIKHYVLNYNVEPSLAISTNLSDSLSVPAGSVHDFYFNLSNNAGQDFNYTVNVEVEGCTGTDFKVVFGGQSGFCNLTGALGLQKDEVYDGLLRLQSNVSTSTGSYPVHVRFSNDDFKYTI